MASEHVSDAEQTKIPCSAFFSFGNPLEEKIADLNLEEKAGVVVDAAHITVDETKKDIDESAEKASEAPKKGEEHAPQDSSSREVKIAKEEAQQSPDDGAYVVPTVDHRSVESGGEEKKVDVPTAVEHEDAGPVDKPQQQGKGIIQSVTGKITNSVKSVFSGFTGGKGEKNSVPKSNGTSES